MMWNNLKDHTQTSKCGTPQCIINNGNTINKPKIIADIANKFFIDKIVKLRDKFTYSTVDPMLFVRKLFDKNDNEFTIPLLTVKDVSVLIKNAKNSWTLNCDDISMNV